MTAIPPKPALLHPSGASASQLSVPELTLSAIAADGVTVSGFGVPGSGVPGVGVPGVGASHAGPSRPAPTDFSLAGHDGPQSNGPARAAEPSATLRPRVAVLIPCRNEEATVAKVVADFRRTLPGATIYVYDNNSTDRTVPAASTAGAIVRRERLQGKGHVVRRMFADIEADCYVLVDGDDTYDPGVAPAMLDLLVGRQLDMVSAARRHAEQHAYRFGHRFGNAALSRIVRWVFGHGVTDLLSGYRVFSRRFVKSFPALASGFETETEFTVHALALHMPMHEISAPYHGRADGSASKLRTVKDGMRILRAILTTIQHERPLPMFSAAGMGLLGGAAVLAAPVVSVFLSTGLVPRLPTAVLSAALVLLAFLALACGLILQSVARGRTESKRLAYLMIPPLDGPA